MKYYVIYNSFDGEWSQEFETLDEVKREIDSYKDDNFVSVYDVVLGHSIFDSINNKLKEDE